jgi:hypothetical protein
MTGTRGGEAGPDTVGARASAGDDLRIERTEVYVTGSYGTVIGDRATVAQSFLMPVIPVRWPVVIGVPPLAAEAFQERPELRAAIEVGLVSGRTAVVTQVVAGDGGTGKTQLATNAFTRAGDDTDLRVWVSAISRVAVLAAYAQAAEIVQAPGAAGVGEVEQRARLFLSWLATTDRSWLVVLDDVAEPADLRGLWPQGKAGRVLVTTRRRDASLTGAGRVVIRVGVFTPAEAAGYLRGKLAPALSRGDVPADVLDQVDELATDLGYLPVALAQAGAVVADAGITCAVYRDWFADRSRALAELFPIEAPADEYEHTVATAWSLAVEQADRLPPAGLARPALLLAAVLDPNGSPAQLWAAPPVLTFLHTHRRPAADSAHPPPSDNGAIAAAEAGAALRVLHRLSLASHDPHGGPRAVRVHALVQRATLDTLDLDVVAATAGAAADALLAIWPVVESDPAVEQALRANTTTLAGRHPDALWKSGAHEVFFRVGRSLGEVGLVTHARDYFTEFAATSALVLGADHPDTLAARHQLARWHGEAGDPAGAAAAFEQLLRDRLRVLGADHPDTLATRHQLARWHGEAGDPAGAAAAFEQLLTDRLRVLGPDHPDTLTTRHNLASCRGKAGDAPGAAIAFQDLLVDRLRVLGPDHPHTLISRHHLANWQGQAGDAAGAAAAFEQLLTDRIRVLGPDHPHTLTTRGDLASWRGETGDAAGAAAAFEQLLTDCLRILGADHPHTLDIRHGLARWCGEAGGPAGAVAAFQQLVPVCLRILGADHPNTLATRGTLAHWRGQAGDAAGAATASKDLLADHLRVLGPDHPHTLDTRGNLAYWQGEAGDAAGAATAFEDLLADRLRVLGPDHPRTLNTRSNLAYWRGRAGDATGAATAFKDLLTDHLRVLGPDHPHTLATRSDLARWQGEAGDATIAAAGLEDLLTDVLRVLGPDHPATLTTKRNLADWRRHADTPQDD